jgi:hypothetical protein
MSDKLNVGYVKMINKHIKKLELNKSRLIKEKGKLQTILEEKLKVYEKVIDEKEKLESKYEEILNFIINRGIFFHVSNTNLDLNQWDSIRFINERSKGVLKDKKDQIIKNLEDTHIEMIKDICEKGYTVSFLVIRVNEKTALIQGRFINA